MDYILQNGLIPLNNKLVKANMLISEGKIKNIGDFFPLKDTNIIDIDGYVILPDFVDAHTHLREPGFSYKETIKTGSLAAASSGYKAIFAMPNLKPVPDCAKNLKEELDIINKDAVISVYPYGAITKGECGKELADLEDMKNSVIAFSDDGHGVQNDSLIEEAMLIAKRLDKIIVAHCEENSLLTKYCIHDGEYAKKLNIEGNPSASEYKMVERDLELVEKTGCKYHVCHISTKESVELVRKAKKKGLKVTCETAPHYLVLNDTMLVDDGAYKMNPPIRTEEDRLALIEGIKDGAIDIIATDHAPHSNEEKGRGILNSLNGIVGLETAFPVLYTELVKKNIITLEKLIELMSYNPSKIFGLDYGLKEGKDADISVFDLNSEYKINAEEFYSKGKSTPFNNKKVFGKCLINFIKGSIVWQSSSIKS